MLASAEADGRRDRPPAAQPYPRRGGLAAIRCPVTLLQGTPLEPIFAKVNRYLMRRLPRARLVEIEGTAHAVHFDRPEEFRDAVLEAAGPRARRAQRGRE